MLVQAKACSIRPALPRCWRFKQVMQCCSCILQVHCDAQLPWRPQASPLTAERPTCRKKTIRVKAALYAPIYDYPSQQKVFRTSNKGFYGACVSCEVVGMRAAGRTIFPGLLPVQQPL